ncbi:flavodoxin domain-containing protein [Liberiplasma polymorphum]|uniref:flavodoxin domain-containing protein n=1 Tax=Liberiplasma polymorphum TaxID=3374570 RepID=UPI0037743624
MSIAIIYATKTGVTKDIVTKIKTSRLDVEVIDLVHTKIVDLSNYHTVIFGSGIRMGMVLSPISKFIKKNQDSLIQKNIGFFVSGADSHALICDILVKTIPKELVENALFTIHCGGEFRYERLGRLSKMIIKMVSKQKEKTEDKEEVNINQSAVTKLIDAVSNL